MENRAYTNASTSTAKDRIKCCLSNLIAFNVQVLW